MSEFKKVLKVKDKTIVLNTEVYKKYSNIIDYIFFKNEIIIENEYVSIEKIRDMAKIKLAEDILESEQDMKLEEQLKNTLYNIQDKISYSDYFKKQIFNIISKHDYIDFDNYYKQSINAENFEEFLSDFTMYCMLDILNMLFVIDEV